MALMPKGQREQVLVFIAFLAIIAVGGYWHFVYSPTAAQAAMTAERVEKLEEMNRQAKSELAKGDMRQLREQLAEYRRNLELIRALVPTGNEVPALLEQVSTAARRVGLDLSAVNPQPVVHGTDYDTYRYDLELLGSYHDVAAFLTNVGSLTRIVLPGKVALIAPTNSAAAKEREKPNTSVIEARFQIETYVARNAPGRDEADRQPKPTGAD